MSTDKPGTATVDTQTRSPARQPEHTPARQPEDSRSLSQYNNDTRAGPPVQRRHDSGTSAQSQDSTGRASDASRDSSAKAAPSTNDRPGNKHERATQDAPAPIRQETAHDTRTNSQYNNDTHASPPVQRHNDGNPAPRIQPDNVSRARAANRAPDTGQDANGKEQTAADDITASGMTSGTEHNPFAATSNSSTVERRPTEGTRSTSEYTSDVLSGSPVQSHQDAASGSSGHATQETERSSSTEHPEPRVQDPASVGDAAQTATLDMRHDPTGNAPDSARDQHGNREAPEAIEDDLAGAAMAMVAGAKAHKETAHGTHSHKESASHGPGTANSADLTAAEQSQPAIKPEGPLPEGRYGPHLSWTTLPPEGRTIGDTTPVGIGVKPDGEGLLEMARDKSSRADRTLGDLSERSPDVQDVSNNLATVFKADFGSAPSSTNQEVRHSPSEAPAHQATGESEVTGAMVVALVGVAMGLRYGIQKYGRTHRHD